MSAANILIVEDSQIFANILRDLLVEMAGAEIRTVQDGAQAVAAIRERKPTLVLTDWSMGEHGGGHCLDFIRRDPGSPDGALPVIVLSGHEHVRQEALSRGANDFLLKPVRGKDLVDSVLRLMPQA